MQVERGLTLSEGVEAKPAWKSGLVFVAVEAVCVGAALWYPGELVWALSTGCISPGEFPATSREMFDPFRVIAVMAQVIISAVSTVLAYRIPLQQSEAKRRSVAALKGQLGLSLVSIGASVALHDPHRVYHCK
ncbi:hypothetical protein [Streptomyces sp. NPDC048200]|uniref:hypothetical protein n=1 Tax=Streptomyces sp. NPDC048200 TaxID=3365512 RepID=UPI003715F93E